MQNYKKTKAKTIFFKKTLLNKFQAAFAEHIDLFFCLHRVK